MTTNKIIKILFGITAISYIFWFSKSPLDHYIFHNIYLVIHEAGHFLFFWTGEFLSVVAGSAFQILIPLIFTLYFLYQQKYYSSSIIMLWLAGSIFDVQVYIADAQKMSLELLGGDGVIHDWNYIFSHLDILKYTDSIASATYFLAFIVFITSISLFIYVIKSNLNSNSEIN